MKSDGNIHVYHQMVNYLSFVSLTHKQSFFFFFFAKQWLKIKAEVHGGAVTKDKL